MTKKAVDRLRRSSWLLVRFVLAVCLMGYGCSGGGGGDESDGGQAVDISVSMHHLDRVYDDDRQYYALEVVADGVVTTVSETDSWTSDNPFYNGVWSSSNTWEFGTTIDVPAESEEIYFVLRKIDTTCAACPDPAEDVWQSKGYDLQPGQTDYSLELYPEFSPMHYHIQGVVRQAGIGLIDVTVTLSGDLDSSQKTVAGGYFSFGEIPNGEYRLTPHKEGYLFTPASLPVTVEYASVLPVFFEAE